MVTGEETLFQRFGKEFRKGTILFREGEPGKEMFVLHSGKVSISKRVRDADKVLATLGPGEFFGEMAIISNKPRNANAMVMEDARLLVIDPSSRVVRQLLLVCHSRGRAIEQGTEIDFPIKEQPREIGVGEPAIRMMLYKLERAGLIGRNGDRVTVYDIAPLQEFLRYLEMKWKFGDL